MSGIDMNVPSAILRGLFLGSLLLAATACSTTSSDVDSGINPNSIGQTNDPAAGFENVKAGSEEDFILNVGRRIFFTSGSSELDSVAKATIDAQVAFLNKYPSWYAKMQGFADDPGGNAAMVSLSQKRADAVMNYMVAAGISSNRLWAKGYGKERVVCDRDETSCKVQNRRVVVNLQTKRDETM
jgi:peptidoglycan-associated lipoprotein